MTQLNPALDLGVVQTSFKSGLLLELQSALRSTTRGQLFALTSNDPSVADDLDRWARLTENSIVEVSHATGGTRYVVRNGPAPSEKALPIGHRLWLYTNFDCNLACDYCCVRSSPTAPRRALGLQTITKIATEAPELGVREIYLTGGEPLLLPDIVDSIAVCAAAAPTMVLTNGLLLHGRRLSELMELDRQRVGFQISIDSADALLHDEHRGRGSWTKALRGLRAVREAGFRVRWAATVQDPEQSRALHDLLDREDVAPDDRVIRPIALRGEARDGLALSRTDLAPEITISALGVSWHPVGADDRDLFVTDEVFPLKNAFQAVRDAFEKEHALEQRLLTIFHCA